MNIASDPNSIPPGKLLSPEASQTAVPAGATGVLTVDLDALVANWRKLEKTAVPAECAGVIKADAYGCGVDPVARALAAAGCKTFFVATLDEARAARAALPSAAIYVLDGFFQNCGDAYAKSDARPVIGDLNELAEWDVFCRRSGWAGGAAIHIDTGLNRLGMSLTEAQGIIPRINAGDHGITLVMSHLACAESLNHPLNARQLATFREIASLFSGVPASLSNSSGVYLGAPFQFDMVRPGAALYGVNPTPEAAGGRAESAGDADPQCRARRERRLWRGLDRATTDPACDRLRRLCRRLFPGRRGRRRQP
jgi:alanine racemase